ncbi:MAG: tRNA (N6-threonylcarbamoyladenosine(37)-N6)-methyltransferase TrmO [Desulfobacterales bacterium]|nr:tRNA (N6-threonylcarbamoyladenosine(37)-N6)-methyltransferase TrmO [Desulfobacterales bacterium]
MKEDVSLACIGKIRSPLKSLEACPKQGHEGAPSARVEILPAFQAAMKGIKPGDRLVVLTWFHLADRTVLSVHPRHDTSKPKTGVFCTRSPNRPNPLGLHETRVVEVDEGALVVDPLEALDGTPVVDIKVSMSVKM